MSKGNQYYRLIEHIQTKNIAKVYNFRTNNVESYLTVLTKKEKYELQKICQQQIVDSNSNHANGNAANTEANNSNSESINSIVSNLINYHLSLYTKYKELNIAQNNLINSLIIRRYFNIFTKEENLQSDKILSNIYYNYMHKKELKQSFSRYSKYINFPLNVISIYIILRRNNIYVTVIKDNGISRIFSPCLFRHIPKQGKKKSMSFFYTVKRTIMYITRFFFNKKKKYFLKIFFKGFQKFRRPLLSRFFFNRRLKVRCIGIHNIDFESFNGCRLRKNKRLQIRGQRKQRKRFSL